MFLAAATATANSMDWLGPLLQYGGIGACLVWFMFRAEPRLRSIEGAIDRFSRAIIVLSIGIANVLDLLQSIDAKGAAKSIRAQTDPALKELDDAAAKRKDE